MSLCFKFQFPHVHCQYIQLVNTLLVNTVNFCVLICYTVSLLNSVLGRVFFLFFCLFQWIPCDFLRRDSYHLQIEIVLFLSFKSCALYLFLVPYCSGYIIQRSLGPPYLNLVFQQAITLGLAHGFLTYSCGLWSRWQFSYQSHCGLLGLSGAAVVPTCSFCGCLIGCQGLPSACCGELDFGSSFYWCFLAALVSLFGKQSLRLMGTQRLPGLAYL